MTVNFNEIIDKQIDKLNNIVSLYKNINDLYQNNNIDNSYLYNRLDDGNQNMENIETILEELEIIMINKIKIKDNNMKEKIKYYNINKAIVNKFFPYMLCQWMVMDYQSRVDNNLNLEEYPDNLEEYDTNDNLEDYEALLEYD